MRLLAELQGLEERVRRLRDGIERVLARTESGFNEAVDLRV